ncbi:MAG: winged helix-turn-helix transcriptional regulator [Polyangiaceae bacterium]|nr:winged helix-turn-helix transcriptional regulator [Polyangiaceae bacterium]
MTDEPLDYAALAELRHQIRRFLVFSEGAARAAGLEPRQHQLLLAVKGLPATERPTIGELAGRLQVRHHSLVELVDRCVAARLVTRRPSAADRREILVHVTARGERVLRRLSIAHQAELGTAGPALARALRTILSPRRAARARRVRHG